MSGEVLLNYNNEAIRMPGEYFILLQSKCIFEVVKNTGESLKGTGKVFFVLIIGTFNILQIVAYK